MKILVLLIRYEQQCINIDTQIDDVQNDDDDVVADEDYKDKNNYKILC